MADPLDIPVAGAAPQPAPAAPAPDVTQAPQLDLQASAATEAPVTAAPITEAPATEAPVTAAPDASKAPSATPEPTKSLIETAGATEAPKPGESKPPEASKAPEVSAAPDAPAYAITLPEGVKVEAEALKPFTDLLGAHGVKAEAAQPLMDLHLAEMQRYSNHLVQEQLRVWSDTKRQWREATMADEQLGGSSHQTSMQAVARMRDLFVAPENKAAFTKMVEDTGVGNHPEFIRIFANAAKWFDEPAVPAVQGKPTPGNGKPPGPGGLRGIYRKTAAERGAAQ